MTAVKWWAEKQSRSSTLPSPMDRQQASMATGSTHVGVSCTSRWAQRTRPRMPSARKPAATTLPAKPKAAFVVALGRAGRAGGVDEQSELRSGQQARPHGLHQVKLGPVGFLVRNVCARERVCVCVRACV